MYIHMCVCAIYRYIYRGVSERQRNGLGVKAAPLSSAIGCISIYLRIYNVYATHILLRTNPQLRTKPQLNRYPAKPQTQIFRDRVVFIQIEMSVGFEFVLRNLRFRLWQILGGGHFQRKIAYRKYLCTM